MPRADSATRAEVRVLRLCSGREERRRKYGPGWRAFSVGLCRGEGPSEGLCILTELTEVIMLSWE